MPVYLFVLQIAVPVLLLVWLAHFHQGSIRVEPGQRVEPGEVLGQLGNSGNTDEPHLHIHAEIANSNGQAPTPIAISFNDRIPYRNARFTVNDAE